MANFKNYVTKNGLKIQINMDYVMRISPSKDKAFEVLHFSDGSAKHVQEVGKKKIARPAKKA